MSAPKRNGQEEEKLSTTAAANGIGAVETVASHLHPTPSWDIADHPKPTGTEEIWRFTPLKRLTGLLAEGDVLPGLDWEGETPAGVEFTVMPMSALQDLEGQGVALGRRFGRAAYRHSGDSHRERCRVPREE